MSTDCSKHSKSDLQVAQEVQADAKTAAQTPVPFDQLGLGTAIGNLYGFVYVLAHLLEHQIKRLEELERVAALRGWTLTSPVEPWHGKATSGEEPK